MILAVIPARFASSRLPGKPLLAETGLPLIVHVVRAAGRSARIGRTIVATDDHRILDAVVAHGGEAVMTRADHPSGTDRVAEVAERFPEAQVVVNLQGDEPEVSGEAIDRLIDALVSDPDASMATLATPIDDEAIFRDPGCVKVVCDSRGRAIYFSRASIPCHRDGPPTDGRFGLLHLGLYAFRRPFLLEYAGMKPSPLEQIEKLEQLRAIEAGVPIAVATVAERSVGIDTPEDYRRFVARQRGGDRA